MSADHDLPLLSDAYAELAGLLLASETFDDFAQQIAELAARTVPVAATCAITLALDDRVVTVASADRLGRLLDEQQYDIDEGPCLQAVRTGRAVSAPDVATERRWDGYPVTVLGHGIGSIYSEPLVVNGRTLGALNMYARAPDAFTPEVQGLVRALAHLAAAGMAGALKNFDEITLTNRLRRALSTRGVIDQAVGIIIAHQHLTPEEAFGVLRASPNPATSACMRSPASSSSTPVAVPCEIPLASDHDRRGSVTGWRAGVPRYAPAKARPAATRQRPRTLLRRSA